MLHDVAQNYTEIPLYNIRYLLISDCGERNNETFNRQMYVQYQMGAPG